MTPHRDQNLEMARGTGLMFVGVLGYQLFEYLYRFVLARGLGVAVFGTFNEGRAVFLLVTAFASLGLSQGVRQFVAVTRHQDPGGGTRRIMRDAGQMAAVAALLGGALLAAAAEPIARLLHNPDLVVPIRFFAVAVPATVGLGFVTQLGEAFRSFRASLVARQGLDPFLRFVGGLVLVASGAGLSGALGAYVAAAFVSFIVALFLVLRLSPLRELSRGDAPSRRAELLRYSLPVAMGGVVLGLAERIDILMIGYYLDVSSVGLYASGSTVARTLLVLWGGTIPVVATLAAECAGRDDRQGVAELQRRSARWMLIYGAPVGVVFALFPEAIVTVLFGHEYAQGAGVLRLLVPGYLAAILLGPLGVIVNAMGRTGWSLQNTAIRTLLNVILNALFIPRWGFAGAAVATSIALGAGTWIFWIQLGRLVPLGAPFAGWGRPVVAIAVAAAGAFAAARATGAAVVPGSAVGVVVFLVLYGAGLRWIRGCLREGDLDLLRMLWARLSSLGSGGGR